VSIVQTPVTTKDGMAKARRNNTVRPLGVVRRNRPALMITTAMQATFPEGLEADDGGNRD